MSGLMHAVEEVHVHDDQEEETISVETLIPRMIEPPPKLFAIPQGTPQEVKATIIQAFRLYWFDRDACVGRLRTAVELFLTSEGITAEHPGGAPIMLSKRLAEYEKKVPTVAKNFEAVKWLGNAGLHQRNINLEAVNDGLRQISRALEERYEGLEVDKQAAEIIANRGSTKL